jgi:chromate transport protein ChrA
MFCDIVVQPPQVRSTASSCISNTAKFSGGSLAILALLLPSVILTITLSSITAQLQQPYEVPSIFQSIG